MLLQLWSYDTVAVLLEVKLLLGGVHASLPLSSEGCADQMAPWLTPWYCSIGVFSFFSAGSVGWAVEILLTVSQHSSETVIRLKRTQQHFSGSISVFFSQGDWCGCVRSTFAQRLEAASLYQKRLISTREQDFQVALCSHCVSCSFK